MLALTVLPAPEAPISAVRTCRMVGAPRALEAGTLQRLPASRPTRVRIQKSWSNCACRAAPKPPPTSRAPPTAPCPSPLPHRQWPGGKAPAAPWHTTRQAARLPIARRSQHSRSSTMRVQDKLSRWTKGRVAGVGWDGGFLTPGRKEPVMPLSSTSRLACSPSPVLVSSRGASCRGAVGGRVWRAASEVIR